MIDYLNNSDDTSLIKCPTCDSTLSERELKSILAIDQKSFKLYESKKKLQQELCTKNRFHCLNPNCEGYFQLQMDLTSLANNDNNNLCRLIKCESCQTLNCVKCKTLVLNKDADGNKHHDCHLSASCKLKTESSNPNEIEVESIV